MSIVVVLGGLALVLAGLARARTRRIPHCTARLGGIRTVLAQRHPEIRWCGFVPASFTALLEVDGQETQVPMSRVLRRAEEFPEAIPQLVDQLVMEIRNAGLDRLDELMFDAVAEHLVPQVRSRAFAAQRGGPFGDAALLWQPLGDELGICLAIDRGDGLLFLCRALARRFGRSDEELFALALANLRRRGAVSLPRPARGASFVLQSGDGLDAARLCLLDWSNAEGLHVCIPDRDLLWIGDVDAATARRAQDAAASVPLAHAITPALFVVRDGRLVAAHA